MENAPKRRGRPVRQKPVEKAKEVLANPFEREDVELPWEREEAKPTKAEMRPPMRDEDPRSRAARRAAEIRSHLNGMDQGTDEFYIDPSIIPDGWTYEWKRHTVWNQEDPTYQVSLAHKGWEPVPASRHPELMPKGTTANVIMRKGQILMERPEELTIEARQLERRAALLQVRQKEQQLTQAPDGTMTRDHALAKPRINKGFEPMPIPKEI